MKRIKRKSFRFISASDMAWHEGGERLRRTLNIFRKILGE